jgi:hypothetical protein
MARLSDHGTGTGIDISSKAQIHPVLSLLVFAGIAAVAYADHLVAGVSLAYLYFLPLALSAFVQRLRTSMVLVLICAFLGDWLGPAEHGQLASCGTHGASPDWFH